MQFTEVILESNERKNSSSLPLIFNLTIDPLLNFVRWEVATQDPGTQIWSWTNYPIDTANPLQLIVRGVDQSLLVRAVIESGNCIAYSSDAVLSRTNESFVDI